jgi:uncharacterized protein YbaR (Trm112 family)
MQPELRIAPSIQEIVCCPICRARLEPTGEQIVCTDAACAARFPVVDGIPVLINERSSVFSIDDFAAHRKTFFENLGEPAWKKAVRRLAPAVGKNIKGASNYRRLTEILLADSPSPRVLVLGGSILGQGMESLVDNAAFDLVESDVSFGPRTMLICDAHDIPFPDGSLDCVIVQAVLEHVVDPHRCCEEIHRVLKKRGVVYAETPFMQQVHGGRYDFMRFTHLGHRRLFRRFEEIDSGAACGPGMALAWAYQYFLLSFTSSRTPRKLLAYFARFTSFFLKYFDRHVIDTPGTLDAASAYYFLGRKTEHALSDRELVASYRGAQY